MTIKRVTAPSETPVSLAEAKAHLRVDGTDEDALITSLIGAAVAYFDGEGTLGRAMVTQSWAQWFPQAPYRVRVIMGPFISLTSVEYYDADNALQTDTLSKYETWLDGDYVTLKPKKDFDWPRAYDRPDAIKVTYSAGFGDAAAVPQGIKQAILLTVGHWFEHRMDVSDIKMMEIPMGAAALIGNERAGWYG